MNLKAKTDTGKVIFIFCNSFVRVLLYNAKIVRINVHKEALFYLHFGQNKLKYFVVTDMKQMLT